MADRRARIPSFALLAAALLSASLVAQLPPSPEPPENPITPAKAVLGKILFWDEQFSSDNTMACGTCHRPALGGADLRFVRLPGPDGIPGNGDDLFGSPGVMRADAENLYFPDPQHRFLPQATARTSPSSLMAQYFPELFSDGRAAGTFVNPETGGVSIAAGGALESQAVAPPLSAVEMAHDARGWGEAEAKLAGALPLALATDLPADVSTALAASPTYPALFTSAFGDSAITAERIAFALATYERTLLPDQTPWDRFNQGDGTALTQDQQAGLALFNGRANCAACHAEPLFTDVAFHNIGLRDPATDPGRRAVTGDPADRGKFKTPSLRNVGLRRRTMHTGEFDDLDLLLNFYNAGGTFADNRDPLIQPLGLTPAERGQIVAFLQGGLTDPRVAKETAPFDRPTLFSERGTGNPSIYGPGSPGSGGFVPVMLARTPPNLGNVDFKFGVAGGLGGAPVILVAAAAAAPPGTQHHGVPIHVDLAQMLAVVVFGLNGAGAGQGYATVAAGLPSDAAYAGFDLFGQWFVLDARARGNLAASPGVRFELF